MLTEYIISVKIIKEVKFMNVIQCDSMLAHAFRPVQEWTDKTYDLEHGLIVGTIFPCLNKPFCGKGGMCR